MKLKKLFWVSTLFFVLTSCKSNNLIPGLYKTNELNNYSEYMTIADEYYSLKHFEKAEKYYTLCLESSEYYWDAYYSLAKTYINLKKYKLALDFTLIIYERDKENQSIKETLAYLYAMTDQKEKAKELYNSLINDYGELNSYYENLIIIYIQEKNIEESNKILTLLKEKFPDNSNISKYQAEIEKISNPEQNN